MSKLLQKIQTHYVKPSYTDVKVGDTVRVYTRIKEGEKERTQYFEGLVIRRRGGIGTSATFTVRRIASGVGVERTFVLHSPLIERIQIQRGAKVRRATLYTMRGLTGKAARLTEKPVRQADRDVAEHAWRTEFGIKDAEIIAEPVDTAPDEPAVGDDAPDTDASAETNKDDQGEEKTGQDITSKKEDVDAEVTPDAQGAEKDDSQGVEKGKPGPKDTSEMAGSEAQAEDSAAAADETAEPDDAGAADQPDTNAKDHE